MKEQNNELRQIHEQPTVRLAKCPCCGGDAAIEGCEVGPVMMVEDNAYKVECVDCGLNLIAYKKNTVVEGWNTRFAEESLKARITDFLKISNHLNHLIENHFTESDFEKNQSLSKAHANFWAAVKTLENEFIK